ncbi:tRNA (guanine-N1)-methyltransferase [Leptolyngbya sp. FACHB-261]|uniref:tRNA (guanine-N1)-methyltransferase n=1 Tax=Leptolyngbya sp. FACHB-261 TaxID=2692806 RepID=UPI001686B04C|nr:tRNA (guanine-N1)-methyltransferase [Leptolyngbya sp. FACHB-261]MBD2101311.1 tRNA (guanine-N1)-methyltransferase [Leptolyngbya sp. FACHB-261]
MQITEGKAQFEVGNAFYNPQSQTARDLGLLCATLHRQDTGALRVLDAMTGCGVRALRYCLEAGAGWVWANDADPDIEPLLQANLQALPSNQVHVTHQDAVRLFFECHVAEDYYDLVDVDGFGNPASYLGASLWAVKPGGLLYLTSTDGRTLSGRQTDYSLQSMGAIARVHPAAREQGLRLLIGNLLVEAGRRGLSVQPVFSFFAGEIYRVMVRLVAGAPFPSNHYAFIGYCHHCGHYEKVSWRALSRAKCPEDQPLTLSGPLWLGPLHDSVLVQRMAELARLWRWPQRVQLLETMQAEATLPPYYYTLRELGHRSKRDVPPRTALIAALQQAGYAACATHLEPQAVKTEASFRICQQLAQELSPRSSNQEDIA